MEAKSEFGLLFDIGISSENVLSFRNAEFIFSTILRFSRYISKNILDHLDIIK